MKKIYSNKPKLMTRNSLLLTFIFLVFITQPIVIAKELESHNMTTSQQVRYQELIADIRCPVCQGESIGESNAPIAFDLRNKVKELIVNGKSNSEVEEFITERYGDFLSFKPPINIKTWILWLWPWILIIIAGSFFILHTRRNIRE